jgi:uncharacterized protein (DUF2236 family)
MGRAPAGGTATTRAARQHGAMTLPPLRRILQGSERGVPGVRALVRAGLTQTFGAPPFDPDRDPGDLGLYGPGSASWRVIAEPAAIVGGVRALLVQLLHPLAMAGVHDHSAFRDEPLARLHNTSAYVTATTFGSTAEALAIAQRVRRAHIVVRGTAPDGRRYRAGDPRLLTWVSIALTSSFLAADRAYAPHPVRGADADAFVAEQARAAALLDPRVALADLAADPAALAALRAGTLPLPMVDDGTLPISAAGLAQCLTGFADELAVGAQAQEAFRFLRWPDLPAPMRAGYLPILAGAVATLEPGQRALLGLPSSRLAVWSAAASTRALLTAFRLTTGTSPSKAAAQERAEAHGGAAA